jgi:actinin alpha
MVRSDHTALLEWCKVNTAGYEGVHVANFSSSWADGLGLCALLHRFSPSSLDFQSLVKTETVKNIKLALQVARESFGVKELLCVSDLGEKVALTKVRQRTGGGCATVARRTPS